MQYVIYIYLKQKCGSIIVDVRQMFIGKKLINMYDSIFYLKNLYAWNAKESIYQTANIDYI